MNSVTLIGRLTKDPQLTERGETKVCDLRVVENGRGDEQMFVDVAIFGVQAETCARHLAKGRQVGIAGRLRYSEWTAEDGSPRSRHSVVAERVEFLGAKPDEPPAA